MVYLVRTSVGKDEVFAQATFASFGFQIHLRAYKQFL